MSMHEGKKGGLSVSGRLMLYFKFCSGRPDGRIEQFLEFAKSISHDGNMDA